MSAVPRCPDRAMSGWMTTGTGPGADTCGFRAVGMVRPMRAHIGATGTMTGTTMAGVTMRATGIAKTTVITTGTTGIVTIVITGAITETTAITGTIATVTN